MLLGHIGHEALPMSITEYVQLCLVPVVNLIRQHAIQTRRIRVLSFSMEEASSSRRTSSESQPKVRPSGMAALPPRTHTSIASGFRHTQLSAPQGRSDASFIIIVPVQRPRCSSAVPGMRRQIPRRPVPRREVHRLGHLGVVSESPDDGPFRQLDRPRPLRARDVFQYPLTAGLAGGRLVGEVPHLLDLDEVRGLLGVGVLLAAGPAALDCCVRGFAALGGCVAGGFEAVLLNITLKLDVSLLVSLDGRVV